MQVLVFTIKIVIMIETPCPFGGYYEIQNSLNSLRDSHFLSTSILAAAAAKSLLSWPTLCDPIDSSPPGSSVPGTLQARILEWVAISFSNA